MSELQSLFTVWHHLRTAIAEHEDAGLTELNIPDLESRMDQVGHALLERIDKLAANDPQLAMTLLDLRQGSYR